MSRGGPAALALLMAAAAGVVAVAAPARAESATPPADCGQRVRLAAPEKGRDGSAPQPRPHADGRYTPILLVHGWRGKPDMWSQPTNMSTLKLEPSVNHSLLGNLQKFAGAAVYTLDYSNVAQQWFREPGAGGDQFIAAEHCLTGNAAFQGHKLIVVAHSISPIAALWDSLMVDAGQKADLDARTYWPLAVLGACFHTNEARLIQHVNEILGGVGDELAKSEPSYAYTTGNKLAVVRNDRVAYELPAAFRGGPRWSDNGRYAYAVTTGGQIAFIDTATGEQGTVRCKCEAAVPVDGSRVAWVDDAGKVTVHNLRDRTIAAPAAVVLPANRRPRRLLAGGRGGYALLAGNDVYWVDAAGKARLAHAFPGVEDVFAAATDGGKLVYEVVETMGDCAHPSPVLVTDLATMATTETKTAALQPGPGDDADVGLRDAWWGRDGKLYATLASWVCDPFGGLPIMPPSLWRLDGDQWVSVDGGPLQYVRQVTGALKAVVVENGTLYSELNGKGTKIATDVRGIAMPAGVTDPSAIPTGKPRGPATGPCLSAAGFKKVADKEGPTIFEGTPVHFTVSGDVTCQSGYAYAKVTGYSAIDWIILRYQSGAWHWAADPYWQQYGDRAGVCSAMPQQIRTAMRC